MTPNQKLSESLSVLATQDPASVAASTVTTGWIDAKTHHAFMVLINTGVLGASATLDAKIQQATDNSGTGAKDVTGKAIAQIVKASGDNKQALLNFKAEDLDAANNFEWFRASFTVGTAASIFGATVLGGHPRFSDASALNQAGVVQNV